MKTGNIGKSCPLPAPKSPTQPTINNSPTHPAEAPSFLVLSIPVYFLLLSQLHCFSGPRQIVLILYSSLPEQQTWGDAKRLMVKSLASSLSFLIFFDLVCKQTLVSEARPLICLTIFILLSCRWGTEGLIPGFKEREIEALPRQK